MKIFGNSWKHLGKIFEHIWLRPIRHPYAWKAMQDYDEHMKGNQRDYESQRNLPFYVQTRHQMMLMYFNKTVNSWIWYDGLHFCTHVIWYVDLLLWQHYPSLVIMTPTTWLEHLLLKIVYISMLWWIKMATSTPWIQHKFQESVVQQNHQWHKIAIRETPYFQC